MKYYYCHWSSQSYGHHLNGDDIGKMGGWDGVSGLHFTDPQSQFTHQHQHGEEYSTPTLQVRLRDATIISVASIATIVFKANGIRIWSPRNSDATETVSVAHTLDSFTTFFSNTGSVGDVWRASQSLSPVLTIVSITSACSSSTRI